MSRSIWVGMSLHAVCMKSSIRVAAAWWCAMIYWFIVSFSDRMGTTFNGNELEFIHVKKKMLFYKLTVMFSKWNLRRTSFSPFLISSFSCSLISDFLTCICLFFLYRHGVKRRSPYCLGPEPAVSGAVCYTDHSFLSVCQIAAHSGM